LFVQTIALDDPGRIVESGGISHECRLKRPSAALAAHRAELRRFVSRHNLMQPRVFESVVTGTETKDGDLDLLVHSTDATTTSSIPINKAPVVVQAPSTGSDVTLYDVYGTEFHKRQVMGNWLQR
jgi:hypothetical protein